jgi:hypothetical protein
MKIYKILKETEPSLKRRIINYLEINKSKDMEIEASLNSYYKNKTSFEELITCLVLKLIDEKKYNENLKEILDKRTYPPGSSDIYYKNDFISITDCAIDKKEILGFSEINETSFFGAFINDEKNVIFNYIMISFNGEDFELIAPSEVSFMCIDGGRPLIISSNLLNYFENNFEIIEEVTSTINFEEILEEYIELAESLSFDEDAIRSQSDNLRTNFKKFLKEINYKGVSK